MDKILIIGTGGTIACARDNTIHLDRPFKILDYMNFDNVEFDCLSPFTILSENMDFNCWENLINCVKAVDFNKYKGAIILHGSDTLSFTGALIANAFYGRPIVITASDKPLEDKTANGFENFKNSVNYILNGIDGTYISYDSIYRVDNEPKIDNPVFKQKNILVINPYVNINYGNYNLEGVDMVLHGMYHSATAPENVKAFIEKCRVKNIPFYFVTENSRADYESAKDFKNIIFNSALEKAYARALLANVDKI